MVRADYPGKVKTGEACIYLKESLSIRFVDVHSNLHLLCGLSYKLRYLIATLYWSPSQLRKKFEEFLSNF